MLLTNTWYVNILAKQPPSAYAEMKGSNRYPTLYGMVTFYTIAGGTLLVVEFKDLPKASNVCESKILALHIHEGSECTGTPENPFTNAKGHYNPLGCLHPGHAGDLPPVFSNNGYAFMAVATDRFFVKDIIGRTVILHEGPDDFTSQPSGNAGAMIACGTIYASPCKPSHSSCSL